MKAATVTPAFVVEGWSLVIKDSAGNDHTVTLKRGVERVFKSVDAAFALAREIGFSTAKVVLRD